MTVGPAATTAPSLTALDAETRALVRLAAVIAGGAEADVRAARSRGACRCVPGVGRRS